MKIISTLLVLFVAVEHFYIAWLEMTQIPKRKSIRTVQHALRIYGTKARTNPVFQPRPVQWLPRHRLVWAHFAAPDNAVYGATILFLGFVLIAAAWGAFSSGNKGIFAQTRLAGIFGRRSRHLRLNTPAILSPQTNRKNGCLNRFLKTLHHNN